MGFSLILQAFFSFPNERQFIECQFFWEFRYSRKAINNHISNLRKKLRVAPDLPDYVKSVYGVGYKFEV